MEEPYGKHPDVAIEITSISTSKPPSSSPSSLDRRNDTEIREHIVMTSSALENQAVDWTGPNDPEKPMNWPKHQKLAMIGVVTVCQFTVLGTLAQARMFLVLINAGQDALFLNDVSCPSAD